MNVELGTMSRIDQYGKTHFPTKFASCFKNRTIQGLRPVTKLQSKGSSLEIIYSSSFRYLFNVFFLIKLSSQLTLFYEGEGDGK